MSPSSPASATNNATEVGPPNACKRPGAMPIDLVPRTNATSLCLAGFYCPKSSSAQPPQYCPPDEECVIARTLGSVCSAPQGVYEPELCPRGFYCSNRGYSKSACPAGYYCPAGTVDPVKCDFGALCPPKSHKHIPLLPAYLLIAVDLLLLAVAGIAFRTSKRRPRRWSLSKKSDSEVTLRQPFVSKAVDDLYDFGLTPEIIYLTSSFRSCIGTNSVGLYFEFQDLTYEPALGQTILRGISGTIPNGSFWAVMVSEMAD